MSFDNKHRLNTCYGTSISPGWRFTASSYDVITTPVSRGIRSQMSSPCINKQRWMRVTPDLEHSSRPVSKETGEQRKTYIQLSQKMMLEPRPATTSSCGSRSRSRLRSKPSSNHVPSVLEPCKKSGRQVDIGEEQIRSFGLISEAQLSRRSSSANSSRRVPVESDGFDFINIFPTARVSSAAKGKGGGMKIDISLPPATAAPHSSPKGSPSPQLLEQDYFTTHFSNVT